MAPTVFKKLGPFSFIERAFHLGLRVFKGQRRIKTLQDLHV